MIPNDIYVIQEAKENALSGIDFINSITQEIKSGTHEGRLYANLIDAQPLENTLELIKTYGELAAKHNQVIDPLVSKKMEMAKDKLFNALIEIEEDSEANIVIEQLLKTSVYSLDLIKKLPVLPESIQQNFLTKDIFFFTLSDLEAPDLLSLGETCKFFYKITNDNALWKSLCFKEFLNDHPEKNNMQIKNWKHLYIENEISFKDCIGNDEVRISNAFTGSYSFSIRLNLNSNQLNVKNIKKIINLEKPLNCKLNEICLLMGAYKITDLRKPFDQEFGSGFSKKYSSILGGLKALKRLSLTIDLESGKRVNFEILIAKKEEKLPAVQEIIKNDEDLDDDSHEDETSNNNDSRLCLMM